MQKRTSSMLSLCTLLVSYYAYVQSVEVYDGAKTYQQRFSNPVGMSPSPVSKLAKRQEISGPQLTEGQELMTGTAVEEERRFPNLQGGNQKSPEDAPPVGGVSLVMHEVVAEPVHNDGTGRISTQRGQIYKWVDANGTVHFSDHQVGEAVELGTSVSFVKTDALKSAAQDRKRARVEQATQMNRSEFAQAERIPVKLSFTEVQ